MNEKKSKQVARKPGACELCGREWQPEHFGSARQCAFEGEAFSGNNWNCGLVNDIREAMADASGDDHGLKVRWDDQSFGALMIATPEEDPFWGPGYGLLGMLAATWYKNRGACDELKWAIGDRGVSGEALTRDEAVRIVSHLKAQEQAEYVREEAAAQQTSAPASVVPPPAIVFTHEVRPETTSYRPRPQAHSAGNRAQRRAAARRNH